MYGVAGRDTQPSTKESTFFKPPPGVPPAKVPLEVIFARYNLEHYADNFEQAGYHLFDVTKHVSDMEVEGILTRVERVSQVPLPQRDRVVLWKALRHAWHRGPGHHMPFISRAEIPRIFLPKLDFRMMDSEKKWNDLDPDRQRQVLRKRMERAGPKGVAVQTIQFEVYQRQLDLAHELRDLRNCLTEWSKQNPRRIFKEDSREEVLKARVKHLADFAGIILQERRALMNKTLQLAWVLLILQVVSALMTVLMLFTAWWRYRESPNALLWSFFISSGQFRSALSFFLVFWFCYIVAQRRKEDPLIARLRSMLLSCERLMEQISDFRERTNELRIADTTHRSMKDAQPAQMRKTVRRRKKRRRDRDMAAMLTADIANADGAINVKFLMKSLEESYKKLPPLPEGFERPGGGGDRMFKFDERVGGNVDISSLRAPPKAEAQLAIPASRSMRFPVHMLRHGPPSESPTSTDSLSRSPQHGPERGSFRTATSSSQPTFLARDFTS